MAKDVVLYNVREHQEALPAESEGPDGQDGNLGVVMVRAVVLVKARDHHEVLAAESEGPDDP